MTARPRPLTPLRDRRVTSNSGTDPVKSHILRESGLGWNSSPPMASSSTTPVISPLRIAKRDSASPPKQPHQQHPSQIARRSSSSYKRLTNTNLVSKSPFKAAAAAAATPDPQPILRKVSGEKRPRPPSMHDQAETENDRPFAYKRERRQSKGFQGLVVKEPVTRSPFRFDSALPAAVQTPHRTPSPAPQRSSLVSKRLHGPRLSNDATTGRRHRRRKTVTFDEECDVVEFEAESEGESEEGREGKVEMMDIDLEDDGMAVDEGDQLFSSPHPPQDPTSPEAEDSITGMVNSMLHQARTRTTPPLDDDDEAPARSHHFQRLLARRSSPPPPTGIGLGFPFRLDRPTLGSPPSTPPNPPRPSSHPHSPLSPSPLSRTHFSPSSPSTSGSGSASPGAQAPLGRTTHAERVRAERAVEAEVERGVNGLEGSPSPVKEGLEGGLVPRFLASSVGAAVGEEGDDPFAIPSTTTQHAQQQQQHRLSLSFTSPTPDSDSDSQATDTRTDPANLSFSGLEMELGLDGVGVGMGIISADDEKAVDMEPAQEQAREGSPESDASTEYTSLSTAPESSEEDAGLTSGAGGGRMPRIRREDVKRRLMRTRSGDGRSRSRSRSRSPEGMEVVEEAQGPRDTEPEHAREHEQAQERQQEEEEEEEGSEEQDASKRMSAATTDFDLSTTPEVGTIETVVVEKRGMAVAITVPAQVPFPVREQSLVFPGSAEQSPPPPDGHGQSHPLPNGGRSLPLPNGRSSPLPEGHGQSPPGGRHTLNFDLGHFGERMSMGFGEVDVDMRSALDRLMDDVAEAGEGGGGVDGGKRMSGMRVEAVTEGVRAGTFEVGDDDYGGESPRTADGTEESCGDGRVRGFGMGRPTLDRALTEPADFFTSTTTPVRSNRTASGSTIPPPPPPKDAIRSREELVLEKRREARRREEDESMGYYTPPRPSDRAFIKANQEKRRRSRSTGDVEERARRGGGLLDVEGLEREEEDLQDSIQRELRKLRGEKSSYHIKHKATIYASSDARRVEHMESAGDVNAGKAWKPVRRPSDMNEYSKQIKEYRAQEKPGKANGKVFVRVVGIQGINVPLPQEETAVTCTLNNGIHFVTTPECSFGPDSRIDQEFELIEHSKLEFTLTLKIKRDPHIVTMLKSIVSTPTSIPAPPSKSGMRAFFSSPKKSSKAAPKTVAPPPLPENLARYLKPDGTLARAFISFKDIAARCDTKLFETSYPLIGQRIEMGGAMSTLQVGDLLLQVFRLPPLPGIPPNQLPQSLEECHRGLRHINWHKMTYFEGTLTQQGGDCTTWRRRQLRVIGANLVAFNDVTKKATATIGLKKAIAIEDDQEARSDVLTPASGTTARSNRYGDEYDGLGGVERSFRLIFPNDEEIVFFADTDEEKAKWLDVLRALVGHIPPNPLWAELIWQRQDELKKQAAASQPSPPALPPRRSQDALSTSQRR